MELIDLNKPINKIDAGNAFSRTVSARKVRKLVKRAAKKNASSQVQASKSTKRSSVSSESTK